MSVSLSTQIQLCPVTVPVEGDGAGSLILRVNILERVEVDQAAAWVCEQAESDLVLGIWLLKQVVEDGPVSEGDATLALTVGDLEEDGVLIALDLVLDGCQCPSRVEMMHLIGASRRGL